MPETEVIKTHTNEQLREEYKPRKSEPSVIDFESRLGKTSQKSEFGRPSFIH
jgi:hypothetical protein